MSRHKVLECSVASQRTMATVRIFSAIPETKNSEAVVEAERRPEADHFK